MARAMTPVEKQRFKGFFPGLDVNRAVVTGEMSSVYNCISWTVGVTNRWLWPGNTLAQFDTFYRGIRLAQVKQRASCGLGALNRKHDAWLHFGSRSWSPLGVEMRR